MIESTITKHILTVGPAPNAKGGIAQVLDSYFNEVLSEPKHINETLSAPLLSRLWCMATAFIKLPLRLITDKDIKIVHMHTATKVSFPRTAIFAKICRAFGRKTIIHVHGANFDDYYRRHPKRVKKALSRATKVVALSNTWKKFFEEEIGIDNATVINNLFSTPLSGSSYNRDADPVVHATFLGLLGSRKGIFDLLEAIKSVEPQLTGRFKLHVGGNGEVEKFKETVDKLGLQDIVEYHGWIKGADKEQLLNKSSLFILPSYGEGLPISILEAMAHGNAVISTTVGGIPEIVDQNNGALIQPGDIASLASSIAAFTADRAKLKAMGNASIARIEPFTPQAVASQLKRLYTEMLNSPQ